MYKKSKKRRETSFVKQLQENVSKMFPGILGVNTVNMAHYKAHLGQKCLLDIRQRLLNKSLSKPSENVKRAQESIESQIQQCAVLLLGPVKEGRKGLEFSSGMKILCFFPNEKE